MSGYSEPKLTQPKSRMNISPEYREELLKKQLLNFSIAHEMANVIGTARHIAGVCQSLCLGLADMMNFPRSAVLTLDSENFTVSPYFTHGFKKKQLSNAHLGLSFLDGQYTDAIFLNRHIIVETTQADDPFAQINSSSYMVFPIMAQVFDQDGGILRCQDKECLCQQAQSPAWWADLEYTQQFDALDEDSFRRKTIQCETFKCFGLLWIDLTEHPAITSDEVTVVNSVLQQTALIIENFQTQKRLYESFAALEDANIILEKKNAENLRELNRAHKIQNALLPDVFPVRAIRDVASFYVPASKVGGDYYDCFEIDDDRTAFLVADVSGHGVAAGLIMSMFKVLIKTFSRGLASPAEILTRINQLLIEDVNSDHFVTCFFAILHEESKELVYCNAGHNPIILQSKDQVQTLDSTNIFVGAVDDIQAEDRSIHIEPDSRIILYTDGLTETMTPTGIQWEFDNFLKCCQINRHLDCQSLLQKVLEEVDSHRKGQPFADDLTIFIADL